MRAFARPLRTIIGAFVSLALAVSPAAALALVKAMPPVAAMTGGEGTPCDMPCDDCGDKAMGTACAVACAGLTVAVPATAAVAPSMPAAARIYMPARVSFVGRDREPDKPPPRLFLA